MSDRQVGLREMAETAARAEKERDAERKCREAVEEELHQERLAHTATVTRAEQAERERDSERLAREGSQQHRLEVETRLKEAAERNLGLIDRAERAEADNAALLDSLKTMTQGAYTLGDLGMARSCVANDHPGAGLLERMRALEKVRELLKDGVMGGHIVLVDECRELSEACKAADAMKEKP